MAGITMPDTSVFGALNRANFAAEIAKDLQQLVASGETLIVGYSTHQEILNTPDANLRAAQLRQIQDFKMQIQQPSTMAERTAAIGNDYANVTVKGTQRKLDAPDYADVTVDETQLKMQAAGIEVKDLPVVSDVKVQMARTPNQKVKFFSVERMAKNKGAIAKSYGIEFSDKTRFLGKELGDRVPYNPKALGVEPAAAPKSVPVEEVPPPVAPEVPTVRPSGGGTRIFWEEAKTSALDGLLSAETLVGIAATVFLAYADKVAAETAIERIQIFFLKEGFAKGLAAGVMSWTEDEVKSEALNRVTNFRVQGMADAAGHLTMGYILKLAETCENYAVAVGYFWAYRRPNEWKIDMVKRGMAYLKQTGYDNWGSDEDVLFHYEFLAKLAWALRKQSDEIVGPRIRKL
jgi:hypothetical protein